MNDMPTSLQDTLWTRLLAAGLVCAVITLPAAAQEDQQDPVMPDIAPRVVEIRGQLEISMPSLERQPLIGFNPPPRVAPIPPDRRPFVEEYKQESVDLPPSPLQAPQPPPVASLIGQAPRTGRLSASIGRYFSRTASFESEWPLSESAAVYSNADYRGSDGHRPDDVSDGVTASYDAVEALVGVSATSRPATFALEIHGFLNDYLLFGAAPAPESGHLRDDPPMRDGRGGGVTARVRTRAGLPADAGLELRYGVLSYETDALNEAATSLFEFAREEHAFEADADLETPLNGRQLVRGDAHYTFLQLEAPQPSSGIHMFDGAGGLRLALGRSLQLTGLARLMTYMVEDSTAHTYVAPDVTLDFYPATGVRLYAQNRPGAEHHTSSSLLRENPYLIDNFAVRPTITTIDARGGGRLVSGAFEADLHGGYRRAPVFRFFERSTISEAGGYAQGLIATRFEEAEIYYAGGDVSVVLPAGFSLSAGATYRNGMLTDSGDEIPYFGPIVGRGALSYAFADGRAFVRAAMTYESAREVASEPSREIGDYFDLDLEATYDFTPVLGVVVRAENLSAGYLERWEHYDQSPFVLGAGLRARW